MANCCLGWQGRASVAGARIVGGPPAALAPRISSASAGAPPRAEDSADNLELTSLLRQQRSSGSGASTPAAGDPGAPASHPGGSPRRAG